MVYVSKIDLYFTLGAKGKPKVREWHDLATQATLLPPLVPHLHTLLPLCSMFQSSALWAQASVLPPSVVRASLALPTSPSPSP